MCRVEEALDVLAATGADDEAERAREALYDLGRQLAARVVPIGSFSVAPEHDKLAFAATTAYLDGLERNDHFSLLAGSLAHELHARRDDPSFLAGAMAALARLAGDLAIMVGESNGFSGSAAGLGVLSSIAAHTTWAADEDDVQDNAE